jgi:hypothetical protein
VKGRDGARLTAEKDAKDIVKAGLIYGVSKIVFGVSKKNASRSFVFI